jgi:uncharacterized NAD(P)/FAD-binding protein YdhS
MRIAIIGAGFSGTMTIYHLIRNAQTPFEIVVIDEIKNHSKGIAYSPYSRSHLLNVIAFRMSAIQDEPDHFTNWAMRQMRYSKMSKNIIGNSFLPRKLYGQYLESISHEIKSLAEKKNIKILQIDALVSDLNIEADKINLILNDGTTQSLSKVVIATGNHVPRNPKIENKGFFRSKNYFQNPWNHESVSNTDSRLPILIIGNGLTMVDSVLGLLENGFQNSIYSISPNGFNILPHRHNGIVYTNLIDELSPDATLKEIVRLFNKHIKQLREFGISAEPVIDSIRPHTQEIWQRLTSVEKKIFMSRLRHLWGVARHRLPLNIYHKIQQLRLDKHLHIYAGDLLDFKEENDKIMVTFYNKKHNSIENLTVSRVINCTGPETDLIRLQNGFLKNIFQKGIVAQDDLKLGINADTITFETINHERKRNENLFTIGTNLKGMLWESTAVPEIRKQAELLAKGILERMELKEGHRT